MSFVMLSSLSYNWSNAYGIFHFLFISEVNNLSIGVCVQDTGVKSGLL